MREHLRTLGECYVRGEMELAAVAQALGSAWTIADIIREFEQVGIARAMDRIVLSEAERQEVLTQLVALRKHNPGKFNTPDWMNREVVASQRIEDINVSSDDLNAASRLRMPDTSVNLQDG